MDRSREYENLANAIIAQAARDYKEACRALIRIRDRPADDPLRIKWERQRNKWERQRNSCLNFFHSEWYKKLTALDPDYVVEKLNNEILEYAQQRRNKNE
jgi:hypothetical protein